MPVFSAALRRARWGLLLGLGGCVEQYLPDELPSTAPTFLVVDGFLNGNGRTRVSLSRAQALTATTAPLAVRGALLFIVDELGQRYPLRESALPGVPYTSDSLRLDPARRYRLRIQLGTAASAPTYESDLVPLSVTPDFDGVDWKLEGDRIRLGVSTHDATGQARYYRWNLTETWQFNSAYRSELEYDPVQKIIVARTTPIYTCWHTERVSGIKQVSTTQLSQAAVRDLLLLDQAAWAERFKIRYSVLVSQVAETPEEYAYYELLRKNTEAIGTVNDPLPSQLTGNVHRVGNRSETVLGFVGAHTVVQKRLFINRADLPYKPDAEFASPYSTCTTGREVLRARPDSAYVIRYPNTNVFTDPTQTTPISLLIWPSANDPFQQPIIQGYLGSTAYCVDCRTRGVNSPPAFW